MTNNVEVVQDGYNFIFMGCAVSDKTRRMLLAAYHTMLGQARQGNIPEECEVYALDPLGSIEQALELNVDKLPDSFRKRVKLVNKVTDLPQRMEWMFLLIDDHRGYFAMVEHEEHFIIEPVFVFSTVQIATPMNTL